MNIQKIRSVIIIIVIIFLSGSGHADAQTLRFSYKQYINDKGDTLRYRMLTPDYDTLRKYPMVIFLHGAGERGDDNELQLKWGVLNFSSDEEMARHPSFVLVPQCPKNLDWANFTRYKGSTEMQLNPEPAKPMALLMELVHQLMKKFPIDTNRIYITGLSMGGYGTYDAIERYPDLFAAAVPVCGGGDTSRVSVIAHIPIWIFHGAEDAGVNPLEAIEMMEAIKKAGGHPGLTLYPEVGHFAWLGAYTDPLMIEWLYRQHKQGKDPD